MYKYTILTVALSVLLSCSSNDLPGTFDCSKSDLKLNLDNVGTASGCDVADGTIQVTATGGKEPYQYAVNGLTAQAAGNFQSLKTGIYTVTVTDANKCTVEISNVNVPATGFTVATVVEEDNLCVGGDGVITVNVSQGNGPFTYRLENGTFTDDNSFDGLNAGVHHITVKDNNDCTVPLNVTVPRGATGISFKDDILPIINTKCATTGCHNGTESDLRKYSVAKANAAKMKEYTQDRSMPREGTITQAQIDLIACWVDDGALDN